MNRNSPAHDKRGGFPNFISIGINTKALNICQALVKTAFVPETIFGTTNARMTRLNREG